MGEEATFPVFVLGAPRSGTTLTYSLLLASGAFPVYEAESRVMECSTRFGRLSRRANFERFLDDYFSSRQFARSGLESKRFRRQALDRCHDYAGFLRFFMDSVAAAQGKRRWAEKTPNHLLYMPQLAAAFPESRFLHVIRDGRDVALSQRSVGMARRFRWDPIAELVWGGKVWERLARLGRRHGAALGERYLEVRFEEIVTDLETTARRLNEFAKIDIDREKIGRTRVGALKRANTAFAADGIEGFVSDRPKERWRSELESRELAALHAAIGGALGEFGYEIPPGDPKPPLRAVPYGRLAGVALATKRFLNRHTPLGRIATKPLEIGLT